MKRISSVASIVISTAMLATLAFARAEAPDPEWLPDVADSSGLATPVVLAGTMRDRTGVTFSEGTPVVLYAYPSLSVVSRMAVGDSVTPTPVGKARIGDGGRFELRVEDVGDLRRFATGAGAIDFEVRAVDGESYAPYSFTRTLVGADADTRLVSSLTAPSVDAPASSAPVSRHGSAARGTSSGNGSAPVQIVALERNPALSTAVEAPASIEKTDICGETLVANLGSRKVVVGATYTTVRGMSAKFTYTNGATSKISVGYSVKGSRGSFSSAGETEVSSTTTIDFGYRSGSYVYSTYFRFGKYSQWCYPIGQSSLKTVYGYKVRANRYDGGSSVVPSAAPNTPQQYCTWIAGKTTEHRDSTSASTWTTGASLSAVIGIDLSTQTGYTTKAKISYKNDTSARHKLCGTNGLWGYGPGRVVARP